MDRSTKAFLVLAGVGAAGLVGTYVLLRRHREKIERAADTTRRIADQTEQLARALEGLDRALQAGEPAREEPAGDR